MFPRRHFRDDASRDRVNVDLRGNEPLKFANAPVLAFDKRHRRLIARCFNAKYSHMVNS